VQHSTFEESTQTALQGPDRQRIARPGRVPTTQRETTMSKLARVLAVGALLTAMSLGSAANAQTSGTPSQPASATQPGPNPAPGTTTTTTTTTTPPPVLQQLTVSASPAQGRPGTTVALSADLGRCPQLTSANGVFVDRAGRSRPLADWVITRALRFIARYTVTAGDAAGRGRFQVVCLHDATVVGRGSVNFQVLTSWPPPPSVRVSPPAGRPGTVVTITAQVRGGCASPLAFFQDHKSLGVRNSARRATIVASGDRQLIARYTIANNDAVGQGRFGVACDPGKPAQRVGYATFQVLAPRAGNPGSGPIPTPPSGGNQVDDGNGGTVQLPDQIDTGQGGTADGTHRNGLDPLWLLPLAGLLLITIALGLRLRQVTGRRRP
jgi:hypothetical protein